MSKTITIEIEIPAPPEGWGEVEWRHVASGDDESVFFNGIRWVPARAFSTDRKVPVARKLAPLWTPPPELVAVLKPGWVAMDDDGDWYWHKKRPRLGEGEWDIVANSRGIDMPIIQDSLFPTNIPWEKCCFKIGDPRE